MMLKKFFKFGMAVVFCILCAVKPEADGGTCFSFTGAVDSDFFNVLNWEDLAGTNPTAIVDPGTMAIEHCLSISGNSATAGAAVEFGSGSLIMDAAAQLDVTTGAVSFGSGSTLSLTGSTINVTGGPAGQFNLNSGSTAFVTTGSAITAADDITFRGNATIDGADVMSVGDDVEFWETGTLTITASSFTTDPAQVIFFKDAASGPVSYDVANSTFTMGRLSIENEVTVTMLDSVINASGDIEDAIGGNSTNPGMVILEGNSMLTADQIEHSVKLALNDSARATFTDDELDTDGNSWILDDSTVTLNTTNNLLSVLNAFSGDASSAVIDGRSGLTYAADPNPWNPNNWNGMDAVDLSLVPEPCGWLLCLLGGCWLIRRRAPTPIALHGPLN